MSDSGKFEEGAYWMKNLAVKVIVDILDRNYREELSSKEVMRIASLLEMKLDKDLDDYGECKEI